MSDIDNLVKQLSDNSNNTSSVEFHDDYFQNFSRYVLPNNTYNLSAQSNCLREFENSFKTGYVSNVLENYLNYEDQDFHKTQDFHMQNTIKMGCDPLKNKPISPNSCMQYYEGVDLNVISETDISSSYEANSFDQNYSHLRTDNSFYIKDIGIMTNQEYPIYTNLKKNTLPKVFPTYSEYQNKNKDPLADSLCTFPENNKMNPFKDNQFMKNEHNSSIQSINNIHHDEKLQLSYNARNDHMHHGSEFSVLNASQNGNVIFEDTNLCPVITQQAVQINNIVLCEKPEKSIESYSSQILNIKKYSPENSSSMNNTVNSPCIDMHNENFINSSYTQLCNIAQINKEFDKKTFICDVCAEGFVLQKDLMNHNLIHIKEKSFVCDICKYSFCSKTELGIHYRIHTKENSFVCDVCCKGFYQKSYLKKHYRIHTKESPSVCDVCCKAFNSKSNLKKHYRIHTNEKPFVCHVCLKAFNRKCHLQKHYRIHTNEKSFVCHRCCKAFNYKHNLQAHYRIHTNEKSFVCHVCLKTFKKKYFLKYHYASHRN